MTPQDHLLAARLDQRRDEAYDACVAMLAEEGHSAVLMDVEHLFDGRGLYFHFLGDVPPEVEQLTTQLAEAYEAKAQIGRFAETLSEGCGPGCGTEEAKGQGGCADLRGVRGEWELCEVMTSSGFRIKLHQAMVLSVKTSLTHAYVVIACVAFRL